VTARAVEETLRELRGIVEDGVTDDEVAAARDYLAGTLPLAHADHRPARRPRRRAAHDLPADYFETHRERMNARIPRRRRPRRRVRTSTSTASPSSSSAARAVPIAGASRPWDAGTRSPHDVPQDARPATRRLP
jgi:hypothetical protein